MFVETYPSPESRPMPTPTRRTALVGSVVCGVACALSVALPARAAAEDITVFAAASLKNALDAIGADWKAETGNTVAISYGGSAALAKQIEEGAPADLFISASESWMDTLDAASLIKPDSRRDILGNRLVLIAHGAGAAPVQIAPGLDLAGMLGGGKLSMALVASVPAGQYGKEALDHLGLWASVEASVVQSENVRAALTLVTTGEAPYGIVYASDAIADDAAGDQVTVVGTFPEGSHHPIVYPAAVIASSAKPAAEAFLAALSGDAAQAVFAAQGFIVLK